MLPSLLPCPSFPARCSPLAPPLPAIGPPPVRFDARQSAARAARRVAVPAVVSPDPPYLPVAAITQTKPHWRTRAVRRALLTRGVVLPCVRFRVSRCACSFAGVPAARPFAPFTHALNARPLRVPSVPAVQGRGRSARPPLRSAYPLRFVWPDRDGRGQHKGATPREIPFLPPRYGACPTQWIRSVVPHGVRPASTRWTRMSTPAPQTGRWARRQAKLAGSLNRRRDLNTIYPQAGWALFRGFPQPSPSLSTACSSSASSFAAGALGVRLAARSGGFRETERSIFGFFG
jgi:hypothetical protein